MNVRTQFVRSLVHALRQAGEIPVHPGKALRIANRREFLQTLALGGAGVLTGCAGMGKPVTVAATGTVAIVGGGVAGLTAAYRLRQRGVKVHLYEATTRVGGRMWTKRAFNQDGMFCEMGGEFVDSNHAPLMALAKELGLGIQKLRPNKVLGGDYYFIDGKIRTNAELIPAFAPLAKRLSQDIEGIYDKDGEYTAQGRKLDGTDLRTYLLEAGGATGAAEWLVKTLDVAYTTEYGVETDKQSALNMLDMISPDTSEGFEMYGESDEAWRITGGSGSLPAALEGKLAGKIQMNLGHRLESIEDDGRQLTLTLKAGSVVKQVTYGRVLLALPFSVLRHVDGVRKLALSPAKHQAIQQMGWGANAKVLVGFNNRFWESQTPPSHGGAFSDALFETWETSVSQPGSRSILTCYIGGAAARSFSTGKAASYVQKIAEFFPGAIAAHDGNLANMDWTHFAFSQGSFSATGVGQYCDMMLEAAKPELNGRLLFAGEHTSDESPGYMNGGVESGERVALEVRV